MVATLTSDIGGRRLGLSSTKCEHEYSLPIPVVSSVTNCISATGTNITLVWWQPSHYEPLAVSLLTLKECYYRSRCSTIEEITESR